MKLRGLCRRSWERIRVYVGGLGSGSGPTWAVLGADQGLPDCLGSGSGPTWWVVLGVDQGLCGRSWEQIRAEKWPWLEREGDLGRDLGRKVAQTRAGKPFWGGDGFPTFSVPGTSCRIFSVDMCVYGPCKAPYKAF